MQTKYFPVFAIFLLLIALLFSLASTCSTVGEEGVEEEVVLDGSIVLTFSIPGVEKGTDGYFEGTGTFTIEGGVPTEYDLKTKSTSQPVLPNGIDKFAAIGLVNSAVRARLNVIATQPGSGVFDQITELSFESERFDLQSVDDPVPDFQMGRSYAMEHISFTWGSGGLEEITVQSGEPLEVVSKSVYDYEDGSLRSLRESNDGIFFESALYHLFNNDPPFQNLPSEVVTYIADMQFEHPSIPPDYDYEANVNGYFEDIREQHMYTDDGNGRIGEFVRQYWFGLVEVQNWTDQDRYVFSYDESGTLLKAELYRYNAIIPNSERLSEWELVGQIDFSIPEGLPTLGVEELFFGPWGQGIIPFFMDVQLNTRIN
jgi:hypothetical protein